MAKTTPLTPFAIPYKSLNDFELPTITGTIAGLNYTLKVTPYIIFGINIFNTKGQVDYTYLQKYLFNGFKLVNRGILDLLIKNSPVKISLVLVGSHVNNGIYGIFSKPVEITFSARKDQNGNDIIPSDISEELNLIYRIVGSIKTTIDLGNCMPPNQIEGDLINKELIPNYFYVPINPPTNTVRRTLSYANYIADGNTSMNALPGSDKKSSYVTNGWKYNWFVNGELRRIWDWPRRLKAGLSNNDAPPCVNNEIGATATVATSTWKGIETFKKLNNSSAWIPAELFAWPCSALYGFYSVSSYVDEQRHCENRALGVGFLFPLIFTSPMSAMGFSGASLSSLRDYVQTEKFFSVYGRPYQDDSDGSGVWHPIA